MISALAGLFAAMILLELVVQRQVLMPSFAELEHDEARTSMKRIDYALNAALGGLQLTATDWGNWTEVYQFTRGRSPEFLATNITPVALKQLQVNSIMIVDEGGAVVTGVSRDLETGEVVDVDFVAAKELPADFPWRRHLLDGAGAHGLLRTNRGIMMLAAAPILDGSGSGPSRGMVIMGRLLTQKQLRQLGAQAEVDFSMTPARGVAGTDRLVETDTGIQMYRPLVDLYGNPLATFRVQLPREITARGAAAVAYASACLVVGGAAALILLLLVLNRVVLAPLARVTRHAVNLGEGTDLSARLDLPGHDEVAVLAHEFDRMLARVADSRRQLMDQSFQAGFAELAKGVLHNLGNAMTPLGVRLATLSDRLRNAPAADLELATGELASEAPGTARHADLQEFLRLGCREMQSSLNEAQADVQVIQRQVMIIQTALTELMQSTRTDHVIEAVRLPDLVSQTLEIVPDACRQRLLVQADESLQRVGVVRVARTVLRLVLQNLIINAADSVRESGKTQGVLRLQAEIVHDADRAQLHLSCEDDGVGIAPDNLRRVFDQGYSTKSRETNHGIGLHWCANALAALGGRIWAASDGPGRGAAMHLMVPLSLRGAA